MVRAVRGGSSWRKRRTRWDRGCDVVVCTVPAGADGSCLPLLQEPKQHTHCQVIRTYPYWSLLVRKSVAMDRQEYPTMAVCLKALRLRPSPATRRRTATSQERMRKG